MSDDDLKDIRERFQYCYDTWREIYQAGDVDMTYVAGNPWPVEERRARENAGRPCLCLDELSQYLNQRINDIRQNKRAVKLSPAGNGANDKTAALRGDIIRTIEQKGGLQAYITGYENALQRGLGFWAVSKRWESDDSFDQELHIRGIPNPKTVYLDPDAKEPASADMKYAFIFEDMPRKEFVKRWPKAKVTDFGAEVGYQYEKWIKEKTIQVAECWKVKFTSAHLLLFGDPDKPEKFFEEDLPEGCELSEGGVIMPDGKGGQKILPILRERKSQKRQVIQELSNGIEILDSTEWEGRWIPILPCFGRQYWLDEGNGSKRVIESLIRKSRDGQMLHNYIATAKMEAIGQVLKAPYMGYEGQFEGHEEEWKYANKAPLPYLQVKPVLDATGNSVLPLPQRNLNQPEIQGYEIADESAKRSIQNGMGMYNASVGRQDTQAKSGKAIQALDLQSDQGNYHFMDQFDTAIQHTGEILDDMIPYVYDTQRQMLLRKADDKHETVTLNKPYQKDGQTVVHRTDIGRHEVMVSVGPSFQSQREAAEKTGDALLATPFAPRIIDLILKTKQLGILGDQMAERLTPPEFAGDQQNPAVLTAKLAQMTQMVKALTTQLNQLQQERESKLIDQETRIAVAEIGTKAQSQSEREQFVGDLSMKLLEQAHERAMAQISGNQQMQAQTQQQQADQQVQAAQQQETQAQV